MSPRRDGEFTTVTVLSSWTAATPEGATALVLNTVESGPIAFSVNLENVRLLQKQLADAEAVLRQKPGNA